MSKYEDYSEVSKVYDKEMTAMGADTIVGLLHVHGAKPLKDLHVLDAGCGTGNYSKALIDMGVGKITMMDGSPHMLDVARIKLKDAIENKVVDQVVEARMPPLPFADGSFDVVLYSLVLHHLYDNANGEEFPDMEVMFNEAKRVLNTGGLMIITEFLPSTLRESLWYCQLNASLCERVCKLFPSIKQYLSMFDKHKFQCVTELNILGNELLTLYKDPSGPLDEKWRKSDSMYGMATEQEISDIEEYVKQMIEDKTINVLALKNYSGEASVMVARQLKFVTQSDAFKISATRNIQGYVSLKVLHHLDKNANGEDFPAVEEMLGEARRVLVPKGIMIITEVLPSAVKEAIWYCQLSDSLCDRFSKLFPSVKQYLNMFDKYSFKCIAKFNCLGRDLQEKYYDPGGPLKEEWRNGVSLFAFATEQEIEEIKLYVQKINENETILEFMKKHDRLLEMGLLTILVSVSL